MSAVRCSRRRPCQSNQRQPCCDLFEMHRHRRQPLRRQLLWGQRRRQQLRRNQQLCRLRRLPLQAKAVPAAQAKVVPPPMGSGPPPKTVEYGYKAPAAPAALAKPAALAASGYKAPPLAVLLKDAGMPMPVKSPPPGFAQPLPKSPSAGFSEEDMAQPAAAGGQWLTNHYGDGATTWATIDDLRTLGVPAAPPLSPCPADQGVLPTGPPSAAAADAPQVRRFFVVRKCARVAMGRKL